MLCLQTHRVDQPRNSAAAQDRILGPAQGSVVGRTWRMWKIGKWSAYQPDVRQCVHQLGRVESNTSDSAADFFLPGRSVSASRHLVTPSLALFALQSRDIHQGSRVTLAFIRLTLLEFIL